MMRSYSAESLRTVVFALATNLATALAKAWMPSCIAGPCCPASAVSAELISTSPGKLKPIATPSSRVTKSSAR